MLVARKHTLRKVQFCPVIQIGGDKIEWVHPFSYLGLLIDDIFSFDPAISLMHRKTAYKYRSLLYVRNSLNVYSALIFARSMIIPYLDYGSILLSSATDGNLLKLQRLQNKVLKCALNVNRLFDTKELHKICRVLTIKDRIGYNQLKYIHSSILSGNPFFLLRESSSMSTRSISALRIQLSKPNTIMYRKSILYNGIRLWNELPLELKLSQSLPSFKFKLKKFLLSKYD